MDKFERETASLFLNKLGIKLLCDLAIHLMDIYPEKTIIQKHICTHIPQFSLQHYL